MLLRLLLICFSALLITGVPLQAESGPEGMLYPISVRQGVRFMDSDGNQIPERFQAALPFSEGLGAVQVNGLWGFIDRMGRMVIAPQFEQVYGFSEGRAIYYVTAPGEKVIVKETGDVLFDDPQWKFGFIDTKGDVVVEARYDQLWDYSDGMAMFLENGRYGFLDLEGNVAIPAEIVAWQEPEFRNMPEPEPEVTDSGDPLPGPGEKYFIYSFNGFFPPRFSEGLLALYQDGKGGYLNKAGEWEIEPRYSFVGGFANGLAAVSHAARPSHFNWEYIDIDGNGISFEPYEVGSQTSYNEGMIIISKVLENGYKLYGFADCSGKAVIEPVFDRVNLFNDGVACVASNGKFGYIDREGGWVLEPRYDRAENFIGGVAWVEPERGSRVRQLINLKGKVLYEMGDGGRIPRFSEGMGLVDIPDRQGFIDKTGRVVVKPRFEIARPMIGGLAEVRLNKKSGAINDKGEVVIEPRYDSLDPFECGVARVKFNGGYGLVDARGMELTELSYRQIDEFSEDLASFRIGKVAGYLDPEGGEVWGSPWTWTWPFSEGFAVVKSENGAAVIDRQGKERFKLPDWKHPVRPAFSEGLLLWDSRFYDARGDVVLDFTESTIKPVYSFKGGRCVAEVNGRYGYIDREGKTKIEPIYDEAGSFSEGLAAVKVDELWGFVTPDGEMAIEPRFKEINGRFTDGGCFVKLAVQTESTTESEPFELDLMGMIDTEGNWILNPLYTSLRDYGDGVIHARDSQYRECYLSRAGETIWKSEEY